ncbi:rna polymerase ii transcription mediator-like protein [Ophiostoma piceae UAMH 11346]|uniref:Mediator of RNA polymerase II transcription subunit 1 n=1 Tax=Ophiostoma piceae (strain UAMH 11346) TaxID=1262450 RepID=S3CAT7_OPHP1|nr:rna polymerase ii transcription mediator-like protein [Ophiostoma piceae UAMH 11346]
MATPTAMKHAASQQGRTPAAATPPVSTPFSSQAHAVFSPLAPRSSPQNVKKSPANSATLMGHSASNSGYPGGPGTGPGSTAAINYDSPAAAAMGAMGLDLGFDNVSVSGIHQPVTGRNNDDERGRRLRIVLDLLKASKGRVSEAGLERLAKSLGLECLWEEAMDKNSKARTLIIAGSALALDIIVENNIVESVSVTFPESRSIVLRHIERANNILLHDLQLRPDESPLNKSIDRFAANLEMLARLDKLSVDPGLNLYEAVAGVYETLYRLYEWDLQRLRSDPANSGKPDDVLAVTVQCARHGRPTMHEHSNLGLGIDYWKQMHLVRTAQPSADEEDKVYGKDDNADDKTWSILVGCMPIGDSLVYQPVRLSDKWLSDAIEKPNGGLLSNNGISEPELDWLEPENTILASNPSEGDKPGEALTTLAGAKLPDVRFNAVLSPPVIIPLPVSQNINNFLGSVMAAESYVTFDSLCFPVPAGTPHDPSEPRTIQCDKDVYYPTAPNEHGDGNADDTEATKRHRRTLFIFKPVYGHVLRELPFSHPSQLVQILSTLRQYAFLSTLLKNGFDAKPVESGSQQVPTAKTNKTESSAALKTAAASPRHSGKFKTGVLSTVEDEFEHYMSDDSADGSTANDQKQLQKKKGLHRSPGDADTMADRMNIDVVLTVDPVPRIQVMFPFHARTANVLLEIRQNAQVHVVSQNVLAEDEGNGANYEGMEGQKGKGRRLCPQDLGRMLEVCEDIGLWCEWIRSRCT